MSKKTTDISTIRKYLNGELDDNAMHRLERLAQDDPFLMDAIEGYENTKGSGEQHYTDLSSRLAQRIAAKPARIIPWRIISYAASVLVVLAIGGWWFLSNSAPKEKVLARSLPPVPEKKAADTITQSDRKIGQALAASKSVIPARGVKRAREFAHPDKTAVDPAQLVSADVKSNTVAAEDSTPLNEMVVMGYAAQRKKESSLAGSGKRADSVSARRKPINFNDQVLQGKVAGVTATPAIPPNLSASDYLYSNNLMSKSTLNGRIIAKDDGLPLPGVSVRVAGTDKATRTDANGRFKLTVDSGKANKLVIGYVGYQTKNVSADSKDSVKTIALEPSQNSLNEVVVTRTASKDGETFIAPKPKTGWSSYKKYLGENAVSPDNKTGTVKLLLTIAPDGNINAIKVLNGLSTATDQKAVELINNGPQWNGSNSGKAENVRVKIKFGK